MELTNAERSPLRHKDETKSSSESSPSPSSSSSSTADSSFINLSCSCCDDDYHGCIACDHGSFLYIRNNSKFAREKKLRSSRFLFLPRKKNAKTPKTTEVPKKTVAESLESERSKDYCPYSSDNCNCSSGCTDCDYGLYTYTVKNKSKLKVKKLHVRPSSGFRLLRTSERSRRTAKSFSTYFLRKKKARYPKSKFIRKELESCYPESSDSCDHKSDYIKRDFELYTTKKQILKTKKKIRISGKLKTTTTLKFRRPKKISKNAVAKVSEKDLIRNWFPDSSNNCDCISGYEMNCEKHVTTKRKKLKNRFERTRASMNSRISKLPSIIDESVKDKKDSKQTSISEIFSKRCLSWFSCIYSEGDDCYSKRRDIYQSRRTKI